MAIVKMTAQQYREKYGQEPFAQVQNIMANRQQQIEPTMPLLTKEEGGFGTALKDVGVGFGKQIISSGRSTAGLIQGFGKGALELAGADTSEMGIKSIDDSTPEGAQVAEQLEAKSRGEQVGKVLGFGAELGAGYIKGVKPIIEARKGAKAVQAVTPEVKALSPTQYKEALSKGQLKPGSLLKPEKYVLPEAQKTVALKYKTLLQSKDPIKNSQSILKEISKQDEAVGKFLEANNGIYNKGELKNFILERLKDVDDVTVTPERIAKLKETLTDGFIRNLEKNDTKTLWEARKLFDNSIKKVFSGSPTLQNTVKREFRNAIQDFISTKTPDKTYSNAMKEMSSLFRLHDNVALQAAREKGMSGLRVLMRRHPVATKVLGGYLGYELAQKLGILPGE